jgi:hypothetical protein
MLVHVGILPVENPLNALICGGFVLTLSRQCQRSGSGGGGNRTRALTVETVHSSHTDTAQIRAKTKHIKALQSPVSPASRQTPALSEHPQDISLH